MSMYDGIIEVGNDGQPIEPVIVLSSRSGHKYGVIDNVTKINITHPLSDVAELSFDVYKEVDGITTNLWDKIKDFKLIQIPRDNAWFETRVSVDEEDDTIKHVTCVHANEAELGQLNLYETEINTESDIGRDDYEETFFYDENNPDASLLDRILKDKAPHYQIYHVDDTLKGLFRQFSFNGVSIQDAFNQIAEECDCLFVFGEWNTNDGRYHRTVSAYDLLDYCIDCGKRGNYTEHECTNCGSTNIIYGYGEDTGIFVSKENIASSITYETNTDEVKNCFRLTAGDDMMTAAIKTCNPNMSQYLWYFSDEMLDDMSTELSTKIIAYNNLVKQYLDTEEISIPQDLVNAYNALAQYYVQYNDELEEIDYPIIGTASLTDAYYKATNLYGFLDSELIPSSEQVTTTTAEDQMDILQTGNNMSRVAISSTSGTIAYTTANSAIQSYAKVYVDTSRYNVNVFTSDIQGTTWTGTITLKSYTDDDDVATDNFTITLFDDSNNQDYVEWVEQSVKKAMANREATNISITGLFDTTVSLNTFKDKLKLYSLDNLSIINNMATSAITVMVEQGVADSNSVSTDVYTQLYTPYLNKSKATEAEIATRELQLSYLLQPTDENGNTDPRYPSLGLIDVITNTQREIANELDLQTYLGDELWEELSFYRRENEYQNANYISDGLTDSEIIEYARRFFDEANKEIVKSATLQHVITSSLYNFLLIEEFKNLQKKFKTGNWIRLQADGQIYKLRLTNWTIDYDSIEDLGIEFSDVVRIGNIISDTESVLSKSRSMATTYDYTAKQANKGKDASDTIKLYRDNGIDFTQIKRIAAKGNTNIIYDDDGILLRRVDGEDILPEQARIYNNGIYITKDAWGTVSTGLGHFSYVDPETGQTVETYGIIADTVIGKLILGDNLKIYSESGKLEMGDEGFIITAKPNSDNTNLFAIQKDTGTDDEHGNPIIEKYLYIDSNGNLRISGNSVVIANKTLPESISDAEKVATNYLSVDSSGVMVADLSNGTVTPSQIQSGKNVLITDSGVKIRDGTTELATYGETIRIGQGQSNNIQITDNTFTGNKNIVVSDDPLQTRTAEVFNITVGEDKTIKLSTIAYKQQGTDYVSCEVTCGSGIGDTATLKLHGIIVLENGRYIETEDITRQYDRNSTSTIEEQVITVSWYDMVAQRRQTINGSIGGAENSLTSNFYANDSGSSVKIDYIQLAVSYEVGNIVYPHYRFGVHDTYQDSDKEYLEGKFSFDVGENNNASGEYSFAQGINNTAQGTGSFVNGKASVSSGEYSIAMGEECIASGDYSQAYGYKNQATGRAAYANGMGNVAKYAGQTIIGKYAPKGTENDLLVVGNGTDASNRSSAMRLMDNGQAEFGGAVGSGFNWVSRTEMINKVKQLPLNRSYNFFASSTESGGITIYWGGTAGAMAANAFGTICKISTTDWHMFFMCGGNLYKSIFVWDGDGTVSGTFTTTQIG